MDIITKPSLVIESQIYQDNKQWVLSKYCEVLRYGDYYCIYNSLVGSLVLLTELEYNNLLSPDQQNFFVKYWFIVPSGTDMVSIATSVKSKLVNPNAKKGKTNTFIIVTSTACNARCWYCFECGIASKTMKIETAEDVVNFMLTHSNDGPIRIKWFGGEPLINQKVMDLICTRLKEHNREYTSSTISNGSFFNDESIEKCKTLWNLKSVQITLDGVGEKYNNVKNYINPEGDPFTTVINNIKKLGESGIRVQIRVNWSVNNYNDICELIEYYDKNIKGTKNVTMYLAPLTQEFSTHDEEFSKQWLDVFLKLREQYPKYVNFFGSLTNHLHLSKTRCQVDGNAALILPDGKLSICDQHLHDSMGDIYSDNYDFDKIHAYAERNVDADVCYDCKIYPKCNRLKCCGYNHCTTSVRKYVKMGLRQKMKQEVHKYLKNKSNKS